MSPPLRCGIDIGSTTVKAVVLDADDQVAWSDYQRHDTRQGELVREFMQRIGEHAAGRELELFGSGGRAVAAPLHVHRPRPGREGGAPQGLCAGGGVLDGGRGVAAHQPPRGG